MTESTKQAILSNPDSEYSRTLSAAVLRVSAYELLLVSAVALSPFQDTFLQKTPLKLPGSSLSFVQLIGLFLVAALRHILRDPLRVRRSLLLTVCYAGLVCGAHLVGVRRGEVVVNWDSLVALTILTALTFFVIFRLEFPDSRALRVAVYAAFFFTILGIVCERLLGPNGIQVLQMTPNVSGRWRGFSTEASTLSVQIVASGMLTAHFLRARWLSICVGILTSVLLVLSGSKGALICLLFCVLVLGMVRSRRSLLAKAVALILVTPVVWIGGIYVFSIFGSVIELNQTSTIATRLSMAIYALITVAHNPFGVGFPGFLPSIREYLPLAMAFVEKQFPVPLAFVEVESYLHPPQTDADCKTFFFNFLVFFGIPFAISFFWLVATTLKRLLRLQCYWLFLGVLFCAMAMMSYYSTLNAWTLPMLFGISLREVARLENSVHMH